MTEEARTLLRAGTWEATCREVDCLSLPFTDRHRRRFRFKADNGLEVLLNLDHATRLRDGDGLVLSKARVVRVAAKTEELMEIRAGASADIARLAWHIGNRHLPVQIMADGALRMVYDPVIADMLTGLGTRPARRTAPFEPEGGAYG